jgi:hypothetical protein
MLSESSADIVRIMAAIEHSSINKLVEKMISEYCERHHTNVMQDTDTDK